NITWWEALEYCNKLSEKYGLQPVYIIEDTDGIKKLKIQQLDGEISYPDIADFRKTEGFRLPTNLEWEWFARGGEIAIQDGTFDTEYAGSNNIDKVAWYEGNSNNKVHNVGSKKPNELGLYDCSGNVEEMCYDTFDDEKYYDNPDKYFSIKKSYFYNIFYCSRICRGGNYFTHDYRVAISDFNSIKDSKTSHGVGIRVVRTVK
ncbi:SUMF1/EgtB/PvdO family nonheme iron enzyme, partial [Fusobacterium mortiferum]|uniref:SUMF1/EgtB/PvdO family nonheme iron enzyme n=1 Tax=Fusobacterium mortiferum TaxID=850 RepID=UPI00195B165A|nr:SUMF1/EgtB/PvdO family nonheme iron enzyme [Fusobacterium mortiferum]